MQVPLVVVGGGEIADGVGDVSLEILNFDDQLECNFTIPGKKIAFEFWKEN